MLRLTCSDYRALSSRTNYGCGQAPGIPCALDVARDVKKHRPDAIGAAGVLNCVQRWAKADSKRLTWVPPAFRTNFEVRMVGVAGFEPATPASGTQRISSKSLIFLVVACVFVTFCSRSFHPIRCDFVAAFSGNGGRCGDGSLEALILRCVTCLRGPEASYS